MKNSRLFGLLSLILLISATVFAQTAPTDTDKEKAQQEKEKKALIILEQIVTEVQLLKLPDNRALLLASAGDLMWKRDEKRARGFFRQSADEIIVANNLPKDDSQTGMFGFIGNSSPRKQILQTVVKYDAELALELLYSTRPANVIAALATSMPQTPKVVGKEEEKQTPASMVEGFQNKALADDEIRLEQSFSAKVAESDPKKAAKLLRESLAKNGVSTSTFDSLQKINVKDGELANTLAKEVGQKFLDTDFTDKNGYSTLTISFLQQFYLKDKTGETKSDSSPKEKSTSKTDEKPLKLDEKLAKDLANKIADNLMKADAGKSMMAYYQFSPAMPVLEKIIPERIALLKQKKDALKKSMPQEMVFDDDAFSGDNASPDKAVTAAGKMPEQVRGFMYKNAVNDAIAKGETDKVREALNKAPGGKDRDDALSYLDSKLAEAKIKDGKIDDARAIIDKLSSTKEKVERLVQMAVSFNAKNTKEDKETALKLMDEARAMIDYTPQDEDAINDYLRITGGFAAVEPKTAFTMLENFANEVNDIVTASALLAKYDKRSQSFKKGEMVLTRGLPRVGNTVLRYGKELNLLANEDIERLRGITDKFQRDDARILLKLYIVQAFFNKKIGLGESGNGFGLSDGGGVVISIGN